MVRVSTPAKINLYLEIIGRRADGYHTLTTLFQKIDLFDEIEIHRRSAGVTLSCLDSELSEGPENIVYRAAQLFFQVFSSTKALEDQGVALVLRKKIPVAAGLGGGSSDAAAVLRGMNTLFSTRCTINELADLGVQLGADVPFFLTDYPAAWGGGIGDRLVSAPALDGFLVLLVNPGFPVSTKWAYENFALTSGRKKFNLWSLQKDGCFSPESGSVAERSIRPDELFNDLQEVTASRYREINAIIEQLLECGAEAAMMSGSGPTVFGLFSLQKEKEAETCLHNFRQLYGQTYLVHPLQAVS